MSELFFSFKKIISGLTLFIFFLSIINFNLTAGKILEEGDTAPNIILYDINNKIFNLRKEKNTEYTLISFSATYCKPCKQEIPELIKMQTHIGENNLKIYLIFVDNNIDEIKSYVSDNKITLPVLWDRYKIVSKKYGVTALPSSFLIDKEWIIVYKAIGYNKIHITKIEEILQENISNTK